jgi:hypothetical protein
VSLRGVNGDIYDDSLIVEAPPAPQDGVTAATTPVATPDPLEVEVDKANAASEPAVPAGANPPAAPAGVEGTPTPEAGPADPAAPTTDPAAPPAEADQGLDPAAETQPNVVSPPPTPPPETETEPEGTAVPTVLGAPAAANSTATPEPEPTLSGTWRLVFFFFFFFFFCEVLKSSRLPEGHWHTQTHQYFFVCLFFSPCGRGCRL